MASKIFVGGTDFWQPGQSVRSSNPIGFHHWKLSADSGRKILQHENSVKIHALGWLGGSLVGWSVGWLCMTGQIFGNGQIFVCAQAAGIQADPHRSR